MSPDVTSEEVLLTAPTHKVPVRVHRPDGAVGWLVWAHGGSWRTGSSREWHDACVDLAHAARCTVVNVDYRLVPHRHPAALLDILIALDWSWERAKEEGDPRRLAVGGDSAGGTLAACAALVRRDLGLPLTAQVLAYPPLDPACSAGSYSRTLGFPSQIGMISAWQAYRGDGAPVFTEGIQLHSTPLDASVLKGTPPTILAVGELDPVVDDARHYARLLRDASTSVSMQVFPGVPHGVFREGSGQRPEEGNPLRMYLAHALRHHLDEIDPICTASSKERS
ncbi:alpha/beta hydrolase [Streptomyces sp. 900116325]